MMLPFIADALMIAGAWFLGWFMRSALDAWLGPDIPDGPPPLHCWVFASAVFASGFLLAVFGPE